MLKYFFSLNLKCNYYRYYLLTKSAYLTENTVFLTRYPNRRQYVNILLLTLKALFYHSRRIAVDC